MKTERSDVFLAVRQALTEMGVRGCRLLRRQQLVVRHPATGRKALQIDLGGCKAGALQIGRRVRTLVWIPDSDPSVLHIAQWPSRNWRADPTLAVLDLADPRLFEQIADVLS